MVYVDEVYVILTIFLWTIFGQFSLHFNTDMLIKLRSNPYFVHLFGFLCTIYLFNSPDVFIVDVLLNSLSLYLAFLFLSKCRWVFMSIALALLITYDILRRRQVAFVNTSGDSKGDSLDKSDSLDSSDSSDNSDNVKNYDIVSLILKISIFLSIVAGMIDLIIRKRKIKKGKFSWLKLFFGVREKFVMKERFV